MKQLARHSAFRLLFAGYATSIVGDRALFVVLGIWTLELTGSTAAGGLAFAFLALAGFLAPLAGLLADRFPRRRVLVVNDLATAALVLCLLFVHGAGDVWIIYAVAAGYGFSQQVGTAARSGFVAGMVSDDLLPAANGLLESARSGIRIVAPLIGAGLYVAGGGAAVAWLDAATFVVSAACLLRLRAPDIASARGRVGFAELAAGFRHLWRTPDLRRPLTWMTVGAVGIGAAEVIPFAVVHDGLHADGSFLGVLGAFHGAGAIVGGIGAGRLIDRLGELRSATLALGLGALGMALFAVPSLPAVFAGSFLFGLCLSGGMVSMFTLIPRRTPADLRGRVAAATEMLMSTPYVGAIAGAAVAVDHIDYRIVTLFGTAMLAICAVRLAAIAAAPRPVTQPA
jgi:MFS family permease